ncbi:MAG: aminotransferase class III-fold pyridoxal phosphate-dependent enzyme, partial [Myxococcales bacterium]|nr:aminotransferase class III-fold pyridoxal phosphate-dependent enzyme [Myxococcales bacterium]
MTLPDIVELLAARSSERAELTRRHLNSQYLNTLESVGLKIAFTRGQGPYLYDEEGRRYLDLVAGSGTFLLGRNHPEVKTAITRALAADLPSLVLPTPALVPGLVAELLAERAPWLQKTYFC